MLLDLWILDFHIVFKLGSNLHHHEQGWTFLPDIVAFHYDGLLLIRYLPEKSIVMTYPTILLLLLSISYALCRNLPFGGRGARKADIRWAKAFVSEGENERSRHQHLLEENVRKNQKKTNGLHILKMRIQKLFMHEEGTSTPHTRHKGRQPLIECANHDVNVIYFLFYLYFPFLYFLLFWGQQGCFPRSYISSGEMRKSDLRSSLSMNVDG